LKLLQEDVSDIPAPILERACRGLAKTSRWLPTAAEIVAAARQCLDDDKPERASGEGPAMSYSARNMLNRQSQSWLRWTQSGELVTLKSPNEIRACGGDGRLIEPFFREGNWEVMRDDVEQVRRCYRAHKQKHTVSDSGIITMVLPAFSAA
jgi:hypothetical protein